MGMDKVLPDLTKSNIMQLLIRIKSNFDRSHIKNVNDIMMVTMKNQKIFRILFLHSECIFQIIRLIAIDLLNRFPTL